MWQQQTITPWKSLTPPSLATMRWNDQNIVRAQNHALVFKFFDQLKKFFKKEKKKITQTYTPSFMSSSFLQSKDDYTCEPSF